MQLRDSYCLQGFDEFSGTKMQHRGCLMIGVQMIFHWRSRFLSLRRSVEQQTSVVFGLWLLTVIVKTKSMNYKVVSLLSLYFLFYIKKKTLLVIIYPFVVLQYPTIL